MPIQRPMQRIWGLEPGIVILEGRLAVGSGGNITAATSRNPGVNVEQLSTGEYSLTLADGTVPRGIVAHIQMEIPDGQSPGTPLLATIFERTGGAVSFHCTELDDTPADPPSGSTIHYLLVCGNSSVQSPSGTITNQQA